MNSPVDKIKERLSIEDVISSYLKLEKSGANLRARCPFHNEKTPSFFVSPSRGSYYCFGCSASGDIFTFVEEFEGLDFKGALKLLADKAGVELEVYSKDAKDSKELKSEKEKLLEVMEEATKFFENNLVKNKEAQEYLKSRGLEEKTIKDFRIGYAVLDWRTLYDHMKTKGFSDIEIEKAGLAKSPEDKSKAMYDRFRGRVMFPINDSSGRVIAFSGRILVDDGKSAKYLNSPETSLFRKNAVLYGLDKAKESIRKNNFSILVEGQMDLILSHQVGYRNTVATSGTALSDATVSKENVVSNLGLVRRLSNNIVLAFDGDTAGINASGRAGRIALSLGMDVKSILLPENVDPADLILKNEVDAWREVIKNAKHVIEFILDQALKDSASDERKAGRIIKEKVLPYVNILESTIEKTHFLKKISDVSGIPQSALTDDLKKIEEEFKYEKLETEEEGRKAERMFRRDHIERRLLGIAFWQEGKSSPDLDFKEIFERLGSSLNKYKDTREDLIFEAEVFYSGGEKLMEDVKEMLSSLEEEDLNKKLGEKIRELSNVKGKEGEVRIFEEINEINKKKEEIKNNRYKK